MLAVETDETCLVRVYVIGDELCSIGEKLNSTAGAYKSLARIENRSGNTNTEGNADAALNDERPVSIDLTANTLTVSTCSAAALTPEAPTNCPAGTNEDSNPQAENGGVVATPLQCAPCEPGTKCAKTDPIASPDAELCQAGTANHLVGATACVACEGLTAAVFDGAVECQECAAGTTPNGDHDTCDLCPAGTYSDEVGMACTACPSGTFRVAGGGDGTSCTDCTPGSFSVLAAGALVGASECTLCEKGKYQPDSGKDTCFAW